ncbi:MAG: hypothetical protein QOG57_4634 [Pseudonocardiales bacterium]|nr:hypothetical protein [Pseudonocardiales bacterium]
MGSQGTPRRTDLPFLLTGPDFQSHELEPWQEQGQTWRRLAVTFPDGLATHNRDQTSYFDDTGLLRRHDYNADVFGGAAAANYSDRHRTFRRNRLSDPTPGAATQARRDDAA